MPDPEEKRPTLEDLVAAMDDTIATFQNGTGPLADDLITQMERQLRLVTKEHRRRRRVEKIVQLMATGIGPDSLLNYFRYNPENGRIVVVKSIHPSEDLVKVAYRDNNPSFHFWVDPLRLEIPKPTN